MGVWGVGNFDNDTACDWAYELEKSSDLSIIKRSINAVFEDDYIDVFVGSEALAAIETIARLKGRFGVRNSYTEIVDKWVEINKFEVPDELIEKSKKALSLIVQGSSELFELWAETDDLEGWKSEVNDLETRLNV